jgi:hypothetical protein
MVTELDDGRRAEHPVFVDHQPAVVLLVDVALDEEQVGTALDRHETVAGHDDPARVLEVSYGRSRCRLELFGIRKKSFCEPKTRTIPGSRFGRRLLSCG